MIKIIKHGTKRTNTCPNCSCVFEYEAEDVKIVQTGMNEYSYTIECPDCGIEVPSQYIK